MPCLPTDLLNLVSTFYDRWFPADLHFRVYQIAAHTMPSAPISPTKKEYDIDLDLNAELERDLLSVIEEVPSKRSSVKQEPPPLKVPTSSTTNAASGSKSLPKKPMVKREPKPKPKEPAKIFMNPNSAAARVANKKSAPPKQEPKPEPKPEQKLSLPTSVSKLAKLAGDLKGKGVKREAEPEVVGTARAAKRSKPSPPPSKTQPHPRSQTLKPPPLAAGLPPKPQTTAVPPPRPQPKSQPPAKKEFSLELPTGFSSASSSKNPLGLPTGGSGGTSRSLQTGSTLGGIQPSSSTFVEMAPAVLSDSESDWDEVEAGPSPPNPQSQPHTEPPPYRLGSLTIEEDPPAGFNGTLDIVDGDEDRYDDDADAEGDGEGVDIDMDDLMAEMDKELQDGEGGEPEGEGDLNEMDDFLAAAVSPGSEQDQEVYQNGDVGTYAGGDMFGDDDYSSSSDDSDD